MRNKIAIFQYEWLIQSYSIDFAIKLTQLGFEVWFLGHQITEHKLIDLQTFKQNNVHYIEFKNLQNIFRNSNITIIQFFMTLYNKYLWHKYKFFKYIHFRKIPFVNKLDRYVLKTSYQILKKEQFDYFIGIEKHGIIWAGCMGEKLKTKVLYYNLELFIEDMYSRNDWKYYQHLREGEIYYHSTSIATIIQDKYREKALIDFNKTKNTPIYLPISLSGKKYEEKSTYFQTKFNLSREKKILIYFGVIGPYRYCEELIDYLSYLNDNIILLFHGIDFIDYVSLLNKKAISGKVFFSLEKVPDKNIPLILSSAHIGLALYPNEFLNDRLIAFSSQKIAYYTKCGIPFISFRNETFEELFNNYPCVRMIDSINELQQACDDIINNYDNYCKASYSAYDKYYAFDNVSISLDKFFIHNK